MVDAGALEALVTRLERVTSLLEGRLQSSPAITPKPDVTSRSIPAPSGAANNGQIQESTSGSVAAFDDLIKTKLNRVKEAAVKIGGSVLKSTEILENAFDAEREIVLSISKCKQPDPTGLQKLVKPLGDAIGKAQSLTEGKRTDAFNNQKVVAESLATLWWVAYSGKDCGLSLPGPHVEESWQAAEFYNNKVLVEYKTKDPNQVEWAKALKDLFVPGLRDYVKKFHTTGPAWNAKGGDVAQFGTGGPQTGAAPKAPPPPPAPRAPPPPPPPVQASMAPASCPAPGASMSEVFKELSKGEAVTAGLKKVTDDMKTKNRADRTGAVPASSKVEMGSVDRAAPVKAVALKPVFELQLGRKWVVENQVGNKELIIEECNSRQSVYIFGCKDSVIQVRGKVNNITIDKCVKTGLVFVDVVAACEIVNCTSVEVQCQGSAPTIAIDNSNGCQLYLSAKSLKAAVTTAKSSEVNVMVPGETPDADLVEHALPEQFLNEFKDGHFVTTPVTHSGG